MDHLRRIIRPTRTETAAALETLTIEAVAPLQQAVKQAAQAFLSWCLYRIACGDRRSRADSYERHVER